MMKRAILIYLVILSIPLPGCTDYLPPDGQGTGPSPVGTIPAMLSKVVTYPPPQNVTHVENSQSFQVRVNGQLLYVEEYRNVSYAHFSFAGTVEIEVTVLNLPNNEVVNPYTVSPISYRLEPTISGRTIRFSLQVPRKVAIHQSQLTKGHALYAPVLFIFADPLYSDPFEDDRSMEGAVSVAENSRLDEGNGKKVINVLDRQIDNSGQTNETERIQQLITEAAAQQRILHFPPGTYRITSLRMQSNLSIHLAGGARLQVDEPPAGMGEPALHFNTVENVRIFGRGVVDGNGVNIRYLPTETEDLRAVIYAYQAQNCVIEGIIIQNPSMFNGLITNSEDWTIYNVKAIDYANEDLGLFAGDDGIDPVGSKNIRIDNVFIFSGDSPISVKGGIRWSEIGDILVSNSVLFNYASGGSIGASDLHNNHIRQVTWENIDVVSALFGLTLSNRDGPGSLRNFLYKNIRYEHIRGSLFWLQAPLGPMQQIAYHSIDAASWGPRGKGGTTGNQLLAGDPINAIDTVTFDGVFVDGELLHSANVSETLAIGAHVKNVSFKNSELTVVTIRATQPYTSKDAPPGELTIYRSGNVDEPLLIPIIIRGTAQNGIDYEKISNHITIPAGALQKGLNIHVHPDFAPRANLASTSTGSTSLESAGMETVMVSLQPTHGADYMLGPDYHAVVTIVGSSTHVVH
ncbi:MAG: glycosyl hydrolase family 28 protein [Chloroflexota bacterium]